MSRWYLVVRDPYVRARQTQLLNKSARMFITYMCPDYAWTLKAQRDCLFQQPLQQTQRAGVIWSR